MNAKVLDFFRAKAKQIVNQTFSHHGALPGANVHDLIYVHINSQQKQLIYWKDLLALCATEKMQEIAQSAIENCERLIAALESLENEYKLHHNNDLLYTKI